MKITFGTNDLEKEILSLRKLVKRIEKFRKDHGYDENHPALDDQETIEAFNIVESMIAMEEDMLTQDWEENNE